MHRAIVCGLLVLTGVGFSVRTSVAQSLADVAKKEADRRKAMPEPTKVYTNKDLRAVPPPVDAAESSPKAEKDGDGTKPDGDGGSKDATDPKAPTDPKDGKDGKDGKDAKGDGTPVKDQAYWSGRLRDVNTQIERNQGYAEAMQTRLNALNTDFVNRDDPVQRAAIDRDRQKTLAELSRLTKAVQDGKQALADLLEDARRAGVPSSWVR